MRIDTNLFCKVAHAAEIIGYPRTTVLSAVARGDIDSVKFPCGTVMVRIQSAKEFSANEDARSTGPKVGTKKRKTVAKA